MSSESPQKEAPLAVPPLAASLKRGSVWMIAMRWVIRGIGFVSTLILARLLDPSDFGIIAMASVVVGFTDAVSSLGVDMALIQNTKATRRDFDTAWTVRLIQGVIVAALLVAAAPFAAKYFAEPRVEPVIWALAAGYVVLNAENIGVVAFRRELDFARDFRFMVSKRLITFVVVIAAAWWLRSFWALVIGMVAGNVLGFALSFMMHPYRPRFGLAGWSKLWAFSQWMLIRNIGIYAVARSDQFIVGGLAGTRAMGLYSVASEISQLPTSELVAPMDRALFPAFALLQEHPSRMRSAYLRVLQLVALVVIPLGLGLCATAHDAILVLLGPKWTDMTPIIAILAIVGIVSALRYTASSVLTATGDTRAIAALVWIQLAFFVAVALWLGATAGLIGIATARLVASVLTAPMALNWLIARTSVRWKDLWLAVWRPTVSGVLMFAALHAIPHEHLDRAVVRLAIDVAAGAALYAIFVLALWIASGRPEGAERSILQRLRLSGR